jgi:hypothetical protein
MALRKALAIFAATALAVVTAAGPAAADGDRHQLRPRAYTCDFSPGGTGNCVTATDGSFAKWVRFPANGDDSPLDSNSKALVVHTPSAVPTSYDYVEVTTKASLNINKPASQIQNLSFDALKAALRGGSPRIVVYFSSPLEDSSPYVAIDALNCQQAISSTWVRADATGRTAAGCTIYTSSGTPYTSDGTSTAWQKLVADNPDAFVTFTFMVFDIPTETGPDYRVDRIALGTGKVYNNGNSPVICSTEAAC